MKRVDIHFHPAQFLAVSFAAVILIGTILLWLPFSTQSGHITFADALFTSTSAVCVTGLIVKDTAVYFSPVGQTIIMILFQLGGLGIMTFSTLILMVAGKKISIQERITVQEEFHYSAPKNFKSLIKYIFIYAIVIESAGTLALFLCWHDKFTGGRVLFNSVFHAVSAFCNAGFSVFSDSFVSFGHDIWVNIIVMLLIILGGLGFLVLHELKITLSSRLRKKRRVLSLHSKLILAITPVLIGGAGVLFMAIEWGKSLRLLPVKDKILMSLFQVVTARTAGFNTMDLGALSLASVFLMIVLMFIGASSGSTGGGVKTSTVGVILAFLRSRLRARDSISLFYRSLPRELIIKAFTVVTLAIVVITLSSFVLLLAHPEAALEEVIFETFSAFGTVGLSLGLTPRLGLIGKFVIILTMYIGRIGPLTFLYAFSRQRSFGKYTYVEESVMIG